MKKVIIALVLLMTLSSFAEDKEFSLAAGTASQSITNNSRSQTWYIKGLYGLKGTAAAEVVSLKKTSGSSDIVLGAVNTTATATDVNVIIPIASVAYLRPGEIMKVVRTDTNYTFAGFISTTAQEGMITIMEDDLTEDVSLTTLTASGDITTAGTLITGVGIDGIGAVDLDYGSADITDHTFTTDDSTFIIDGGITVSTGDKIQIGSTQWNSGDSIDGEQIAADTIDDDSIDFSDVTGADLTLTDCTAITASGDITANGNIVGDDSTVITNIAAIYLDTIEEDGTEGVAIEGLTLNDGAYTDADGTLTISNITVNGTATITGGIVGGITTNFTFLSATDVTGQVWFAGGTITNVDTNIND